MQHIKQNDQRCIKTIRKIGCFCRSCGLIAEYRTNQALTAEQINELWHWSKENAYIDEKDNVVLSAPIINHALRMLGNKNGHFYECATFKEGVMYWYPSIAVDDRRAVAYIQKVQTINKNTHFRLIDKYGELIEDPYTPTPKVKKVYYTICYGYTEDVNG